MKSKKNKEAKNEEAIETPKKTGKLQEQLDKITKEKDELFARFQRLNADYANYQKRIPKQIADTIAYEKKAIIKSLLPCIDNFAHALANADSNDNVDTIIKGMRIVFDHLLDTLKSLGVEQITAVGKDFDPASHEAMQMRVEDDKPDNIVLEEFQIGYTFNGQVIRPARVIVNKLPGEEHAEDENQQEETPKDRKKQEEQQ